MVLLTPNDRTERGGRVARSEVLRKACRTCLARGSVLCAPRHSFWQSGDLRFASKSAYSELVTCASYQVPSSGNCRSTTLRSTSERATRRQPPTRRSGDWQWQPKG